MIATELIPHVMIKWMASENLLLPWCDEMLGAEYHAPERWYNSIQLEDHELLRDHWCFWASYSDTNETKWEKWCADSGIHNE